MHSINNEKIESIVQSPKQVARMRNFATILSTLPKKVTRGKTLAKNATIFIMGKSKGHKTTNKEILKLLVGSLIKSLDGRPTRGRK
jgi:hypothetical protein